jgi:hypothetical protein
MRGVTVVSGRCGEEFTCGTRVVSTVRVVARPHDGLLGGSAQPLGKPTSPLEVGTRERSGSANPGSFMGRGA